MKKIFTLFALSAVFSFSVFALTAEGANRRTALRCLANATNYAQENQFASAISQASLGIEYDETISDLWYISAFAGAAMGQTKAQVLPVLEKALFHDSWVNYNRDNARLMYADILSDTCASSAALMILDEEPALYSSDAEYIRVKCYYRIGGDANISKARNKIDGARRIYPDDTRFPLVFFKYEKTTLENPSARRLAEAFIRQSANYQEADPDKNAELEILAASFATGESKKKLLKSFSARGLKHPLYAREAMSAGIFTQSQAAEYITQFADKGISLGILSEFVSLLDDRESLEYLGRYLEAFGGSIYQDTDGDGIDNVLVEYSRGRAVSIIYDENQDGLSDLTLECDFGVPVSGALDSKNMTFTWSSFPYLSTVEFNAKHPKAEAREKFVFADESLTWSPVDIFPEPVITAKTGFEFFFPGIRPSTEGITNSMLLDAASSFIVDTERSNGERIHFVLLDGDVQQALYYKNGTMYAQTQFRDNLPFLKINDCDGDGIFETTEFYAVDEDSTMEVHSLQDERSIMNGIYGVPSDGAEFYLKMVQVDTNGDTVPDFTEEYLPHGGKITSWDNEGDGKWNVRYVLYPRDPNGDSTDVIEESMFHTVPDNVFVTVRTVNKVPVMVRNGSEELSVVKGTGENFCWLSKRDLDYGQKEYVDLERAAVQALDREGRQGTSLIARAGKKTVMCVRVGGYDYAVEVNLDMKYDHSNEKDEN